eukprot:CAMPEP_0176010268 /NCGR_PEP_ID=MMETSP0120_2-20121206/4679_1 /TAXON_ID=160619 /ORGANISM="Kryptoperidinium foliaceum, Strain CCMP 1326" /LENGTH=491 /DNA_ID=CAMNT_0017343091 /DNA_START=44 /DNA_END=1519 /DNA_ORIENTATION=+
MSGFASTLALLAMFIVRRSVAEDAHGHDDHGHDHAGHAREAHPWEWSGTFALDDGETYSWTAARGLGGAYADDDMKLGVFRLPESGGLEAIEEAAEKLFEGSSSAWANKTSGSTLVLGGSASFRLIFDRGSWVSLFYMKPGSSGRYAFFAQHLPTEFENGFHFLKDEHGADVEALEGGLEAAETEASNEVGLAIGGAIIGSLPALLMIPLVGPAIAKVSYRVFDALNSFSSGVILAAAVFLLLPEGLHLAGVGLAESDAAAVWGVGIMLGWLVGVFSHYLGHLLRGEAAHENAVHAWGEKEQSAGLGGRMSAGNGPIDSRVVTVVLFGDFFHNLVDGMIIGFAAKCNSSAFWSSVGATVAHESTQEVADFIVLLTKGRMHWGWATFLNFATALPASIIGALVAHQAGVSANVQGFFYAFGGGVYLFIAVTELAPSLMSKTAVGSLETAARLLAFVVGAVCIGLVLIDHTHCMPEGSEGSAADADPHAGHAH